LIFWQDAHVAENCPTCQRKSEAEAEFESSPYSTSSQYHNTYS
jgi:hypothetical protein